MANVNTSGQTRNYFTPKGSGNFRGLTLASAAKQHSEPTDGKIPEPLLSALRDAGYTGTDSIRDFAANAASAQQIFQFFLTETPEKPWEMVDKVMRDNIRLKRELATERLFCRLFANIYDAHVCQHFKIEEWLDKQGLQLPEEIQNIGKAQRLALLRAEGLYP